MRLLTTIFKKICPIFPLGRLALFVLLQSLSHDIVAHAFVLMDYFKSNKKSINKSIKAFRRSRGDHEQDIAST